jgi:hypothetical protein
MGVHGQNTDSALLHRPVSLVMLAGSLPPSCTLRTHGDRRGRRSQTTDAAQLRQFRVSNSHLVCRYAINAPPISLPSISVIRALTRKASVRPVVLVLHRASRIACAIVCFGQSCACDACRDHAPVTCRAWRVRVMSTEQMTEAHRHHPHT